MFSVRFDAIEFDLVRFGFTFIHLKRWNGAQEWYICKNNIFEQFFSEKKRRIERFGKCDEFFTASISLDTVFQIEIVKIDLFSKEVVNQNRRKTKKNVEKKNKLKL